MRITQILAVALLLVALVAGRGLKDFSKLKAARVFDLEGRSDNVGSSASSCYKYTCNGNGATCGVITGSTNTYAGCNNGYYCNVQSGLTGTCTAQSALGGSCSASNDNADCSGLNECVSGTCNSGYGAGAKCTTNNNCDTSSGQTCTSGLCAGLAAGATCTGEGQCNPPLACNGTCVTAGGMNAGCASNDDCQANPTYLVCVSGTCQAATANGQTCSASNEDQCGVTSMCTPQNSGGTSFQCAAAFGGAAGSYCDDSDQCQSGTYCNTSSSNPISTCVSAATSSSYKSCTYPGGSGCNAGEECACNVNNGGSSGICVAETYGNPSGIQSAYNNLMNCWAGKCQRTDPQCAANNCNSYFCNYYNTGLSELRADAGHAPSCVLRSFQYNDGFFHCSSGVAVQYSVVLLFVAAIAAIVM